MCSWYKKKHDSLTSRATVAGTSSLNFEHGDTKGSGPQAFKYLTEPGFEQLNFGVKLLSSVLTATKIQPHDPPQSDGNFFSDAQPTIDEIYG